MQQLAALRTRSLISLAPAAAAAGIVVWAASIWWMVATLPASGSESRCRINSFITSSVTSPPDDMMAPT